MLITVIEGKKNSKKNIVVVLATMMSVSPALYSSGIVLSLNEFIKYIICYLFFIIICSMALSLFINQKIYIYSDRIDVQFGFIRKKYYLNCFEKCYLRNRAYLNIKLKNGKYKEIVLNQYKNSSVLIDFLRDKNICIEELIV